jgi:RNA polymerase-binding transcription factor DksA
MRQAVLVQLYNRLATEYAFEEEPQDFVSGMMSLHDLDMYLSFKSDQRLEDLRAALGRIDSGTYGLCLSCGQLIGQRLLDYDPARRVCPQCESRLNTMAVQVDWPEQDCL